MRASSNSGTTLSTSEPGFASRRGIGRSISLGLLVVGLLGVLLRSAAAAEPVEAHKLAKPRDDLPGLSNFAEVSDALWRGAQPTAEGFAELKRLGVKTIIDLRAEHSDRDLLTGNGLQYVEIPCLAWDPEEKNVLKVLKIVTDPKNQPVFVHCQAGADRTGMMVAVYRMTQQGWTSKEALKELPEFHFHPIFANVALYLIKFDPAAIRKKLEQTAPPKIEVVK
jgi:protein tyrosine phosphatase (PTP) superfamily phosphohydrolase (DUF442 family)